MNRSRAKVRSELANAGKRARKAPGDPCVASHFDRLRVEYRAETLAETITDGLRDVTDVDVWAERIDSALPRLTEDQAAAAGRLAAVLDDARAQAVARVEERIRIAVETAPPLPEAVGVRLGELIRATESQMASRPIETVAA